MTEDYYEILQVHINAEIEVIEAAYRRLARKYHPDVNKNPDAEERMKLILLTKSSRILQNAQTMTIKEKNHHIQNPVIKKRKSKKDRKNTANIITAQIRKNIFMIIRVSPIKNHSSRLLNSAQK